MNISLKNVFSKEQAKWRLIEMKALNWVNPIMNNQWGESINQLVYSSF